MWWWCGRSLKEPPTQSSEADVSRVVLLESVNRAMCDVTCVSERSTRRQHAHVPVKVTSPRYAMRAYLTSARRAKTSNSVAAAAASARQGVIKHWQPL